MSRLHATLVALVLGAVASAGAFAAVKTVRLGQKVSTRKQPAAATELASRQAKLDRWSRSLRRARGKRPPSLPKLPKFAPVPAAAPAPAPPPVAGDVAAAPTVTYVRPKPVVEYRHAKAASTTATSTQRARSDDDGASDDSATSDDGHGDGGSTAGGD